MAQTLFSQGRWAQAEPLCRSILAREADHPGALTLLGIMLAQTRRTLEAAELLGRAARGMPGNPEAHNNYGSALRDLGRHESALSCYERALALKPDYAEAHYNRGLTLHGLRRRAEALRSYDQALSLRPDYAAAWNNRGTVLREMERLQEALHSYDRAITARPDHAGAHANRGAMLHRLERYGEALASFERVLAIAPDDAEAHANRGATLNALKRFDEALPCFDTALAIDPNNAEAHLNRGAALHALERYDVALESFARALAIAPDYAKAHANRGATLNALRRLEEALVSFDRAIAINPQCAAAHLDRGSILFGLKRFEEALESFDRALALGRRDAAILCCRADTLLALNRPEAAIDCYEQALRLDPGAGFLLGECRHTRMKLCDWSGFEDDLATISAAIERGEIASMPFTLLSLIDSPSLQLRLTQAWARERVAPRNAPPAPRHHRHERIRIGYFSADLRNHAVAMLTAELFETHDRSRFELTAFSLGPDARDEMRTRVEAAFERFLPLNGQSDQRIAQLARELEIDIAVDLGGYTHDARPGILALRAAPVQVSYLGYLGTMGREFIDYLIADPVLVPPESRQHYSEKIAYLPSYQVNDSKRPVPDRTLSRAELGLPPQGFVFCCFNNTYKITPGTFDSWMRILGAVPESVLFLLGSSATAEGNLRREAASRGVAPERLVFGRPLPFADYLGRYRVADLFLDTLPYNAGTTASDALWAGLPVLTCPGESFAARMAASVLTAAGLPELIASGRIDYERQAIGLATDPGRLGVCRQKLTENRGQCALFDTATFTRNLEALFTRMHQRSLGGLPPEHLYAS